MRGVKWSLFLLVLFAISFGFSSMITLGKLKEKKNRRVSGFEYAFFLLSQTKPQVIIETGTLRQGSDAYELDGASTLLFTEFAKQMGAEFFTIDNNQKHLNEARQVCIETFGNNLPTKFIHSDSIAYLKTFSKKIDCLYLDSFEFNWANPKSCQLEFLEEIKAAYPHLSEKCIVILDDCGLPDGGQGAEVVRFLKDKGWRVIFDGYQVIMML